MSGTLVELAKVTVTVVGNAGSFYSTILPPASTAVAYAAAASIFDPSHPDPTTFDPTDPIILFIIQASIIIALSRFLGYFLGKIRQPRVIAEVIGGIILGPSAFGRIPGFTSHIFPPASISYLNLVATIGLIFFLFLVGLEVDFSLFRKNIRTASAISFFGMAVPFALGAAVSKGIYDRFVDESKVKFGTFLLFIGTANAITAFPVLARILTELDLLTNHVGVIVLSAGVGNDVVGWILLALAIALVNASSGLIVLYVLLTSFGWILVLFFLVRPLLVYICKRSGSYGGEKGPTQSLVCLVIFLVLASAWITDRIGIHAIFGAFLVGLIVPGEIRRGLTEKIEDLVTVLFLPLYFALSGLKTDLGLLANGSIWGWTVCVIVVAFFGKFISCGLAARATGMNWRESGAVGSLMACKGLVELIVLNIGLSAGILNAEVFAMFVTMALVTTFVTTPLTIAFYPLSYRIQQDRERIGIVEAPTTTSWSGDLKSISRFSMVLERFDHLSAVIEFCRLIKAPIQFDHSTETSSMEKSSTSHDGYGNGSNVSVDALRLIELSDRTSDLIKASESHESLLAADTLSQVFSTFARGSGIPTTNSLSVIAQDSYSTLVSSHAASNMSDMIILPWVVLGGKSEEGVAASLLPNPFESIFRKGMSSREGSAHYATFARKVFAEASCDVGLFLHRGVNTSNQSQTSGRSHLFLAFHGGSDDRACLDFIVQLASRNPGITATVVRIIPSSEPTSEDGVSKLVSNDGVSGSDGGSTAHEVPVLFSQLTVQGGGGAVDTIYPGGVDLQSESADNISLNRWFSTSTPSSTHTKAVEDGLTRINYSTITTSQPLHLSIARARATALDHSSIPMTIIVGRGRRDARSHHVELGQYLKSNLETVQSGMANSSEVRRSLGDLGVAYLVSEKEVGGSVLVVQSAGKGGVVKNKGV